MEFNALSGSDDFIIERDFRLNLIKQKKLFPYLQSKVLKNGKPIHVQTAKKAFQVESFEKLTLNLLAVWLESEILLRSIIVEESFYAKE